MSSHFNNSKPSLGDVETNSSNAGNTTDEGLLHSSYKQSKMSNLTKNLLSSSQILQVPQNQEDQSRQSINLPMEPPNYLHSTLYQESSSIPNHNANYYSNSQATSIPMNAFPSQGPFKSSLNNQHTPSNNSLNYIPSSHNTPTVISTSYSSNHSFTPTFQSSNNFRPTGSLSHSIPTSNVTTKTVHPHSTAGNSFNSSQSQPISMNNNPLQSIQQTQKSHNNQQLSSQQLQQLRIPHSLPTGGSFGYHNSYSAQPRFQARSESTESQNTAQLPNPSYNNRSLYNMNFPHSFSNSGPDRYMSYSEFFDNLCNKNNKEDANYEEHLNIVDFPVNDLIMMLSCLLTKIIEANDKLHPNHFDNTISQRQKAKEEKKLRKLQKLREQNKNPELYNDDVNLENIQLSDDEEDEMKNKYLANVLAFHGTNVPGISLHAYLARVLKYCPVTNEVFLSLLVYFDRIAKKANNMKKRENEEESEQLFVMDSYNIHRLIISGITVSSKFFSDIFYKNLRYAKVGGLPLEELNYLELQFLLLLDFKLMISVEDLQNYGDLLLRFWKRDRLANDIMNSSGSQQLGTVQNLTPSVPNEQLAHNSQLHMQHSDYTVSQY